MGVVHRAFDRHLGRELAVKVLRTAGAFGAARLLDEARAQASVEHPNVVKVYGVGYFPDGRAFIAMQLVHGESIDLAMGRMSLRERVDVAVQVASGLAAAHDRGLVHRDVKPRNVLVERHGSRWHAFLVDFGIALPSSPGIRESSQATGSRAAGTPGFMAPEQAQGEVVDARADVFGFGVTLCSLLGDPSTSRDLELIAKRCTQVDAESRYATMHEVRDDLVRWLARDPVSVRQGLAYRLARLGSKHRLAVVWSLVAFVTLVVSLVALTRAERRAARAAEQRERIGRNIERFDRTMRQAALRPVHDIDEERRPLREELAAFESEVRTLGAPPPRGRRAEGLRAATSRWRNPSRRASSWSARWPSGLRRTSSRS
jgi:serine/threonine-protein kinase